MAALAKSVLDKISPGRNLSLRISGSSLCTNGCFFRLAVGRTYADLVVRSDAMSVTTRLYSAAKRSRPANGSSARSFLNAACGGGRERAGKQHPVRGVCVTHADRAGGSRVTHAVMVDCV